MHGEPAPAGFPFSKRSSMTTPAGYQLRRAVRADIPEIIRIWKEGQGTALGVIPGDTDTGLQAFFEARIDNQTAVFQIWVADEGGRSLLGWQALSRTRNHPLLHDRVAESSTYVGSSSRGRRVGSALIAKACEHAQATGRCQIFGLVSVANESMCRILERAGWERVGDVRPPPRLPDIPTLGMWVYAVPNGKDTVAD
jgi:L-amino acid N-acyltransferase YncA